MTSLSIILDEIIPIILVHDLNFHHNLFRNYFKPKMSLYQLHLF